MAAKRLFWCIGSLLMLLVNDADAAGRVEYKQYRANLKGQALVLHAGSLSFPGTHATGPAIASANECRKRCAILPGCNGYTYCEKPGGCGRGCASYVQRNPSLPAGGPGPSISPSTKLPIKGFGPFGSCAGSAWPQGLCALKVAANPSKPTFWSRNKADGWVSGTVVTPDICQGVAGAVCAHCLKSKNPKGCLDCAKRAPKQLLTAALGNLDLLALGCPKCFGSQVTAALQAKCVDCVVGGKACSKCAVQGRYRHSVPLCLNCFAAEPAAAQRSCLSCANIASPGKAATCATKCLPRFRKTWCSAKEEANAGDPRPKCTKSFSNVCRLCGQSTQPEQCISCALKQPGSADCPACSTVKPEQQAKCFHCAAKSYAKFTPCTDCVNFGDKSGQCLQCAQSSKVSYPAKAWCLGCVNWYSNAAQQDKCYRCLESDKKDYFSTCSKL